MTGQRSKSASRRGIDRIDRYRAILTPLFEPHSVITAQAISTRIIERWTEA